MRKLFIILSFLLIIAIVAYAGVGIFFYEFGLRAERFEPAEEDMAWLSDHSEDTYIMSTNYGELKLHAYEVINENESNVWVILVHGYKSYGAQMVGFADYFYNRGYNVLILDLRGHGQSEGDYIGMGWQDRLDVIDWINYLTEKDGDSKIILYGISMGGSTVMMVEGEELPSNVKLAIEDCGYTSAWEEFSYQIYKMFQLPEFPVLYAADNVCQIKQGYSLKEASSIEQLKKAHLPTLFIHGSADSLVPYRMLDIIYESANDPKEELVIENAEHTMSIIENPELYKETIDRFIEEYLYVENE